ncbi:MAG: hypothetical protein AAFV43_09865 [Planctomycetota bacterium]
MSESNPKPPNGEQGLNERLVAYLDRELAPGESEAIEAELARDETTRSHLEGLDRAWRALDALPLERTEADFTRTTLALAAQSSLAGPRATTLAGEAARPIGPKPSIWRRLRWLAPAAGGLVAFALAWLAAWAPQARTLQDLPATLASDALKQIDSLEFLRTLAERSEGELDRAAADPAIASEAREWFSVGSMTHGERRAWVESLDETRRQEVARRVAAQRAAGAAASTITDRYEALLASEERERLAGYAVAYAAYLDTLSTGQQAELRTTEPTLRARRVAKGMRRWRVERSLVLAADESDDLAEELQRLVTSDVVAAIIRDTQSGRRRRDSPVPPEMIQRQLARSPAASLARIGAFYLRSGSGGTPRGPRDAIARVIGGGLRDAWPRLEEPIVRAMPRRLRELIDDEKLAGSARTQAVVSVLRQAAAGDGPEDLGEVVDQLDSGELIELLSLPNDQMIDRLESESRGAQAEWTPGAGGFPPSRFGPEQGGPDRGRRGPGRDRRGPGGFRPPAPDRSPPKQG